MGERYYSCLFLPSFMKNDIHEKWKSRQIKTKKSDPCTGWLNDKWQVSLSSDMYSSEIEYIKANIHMVHTILDKLPCTGQSRGTNQVKYHEARLYCLVNQKWDTQPLLNPNEAPEDLQNLQIIDGVHPYQFSDIGYMLAALSMQDRMYGPECELIAWAATKFDEKSYAGDTVVRFYIRGEQQLLFNEIKWYLLSEFQHWYPRANQHQKFMYIKNRMPTGMIYYNVLYDTKKVIEELKTRMKEIGSQDLGDPDITPSTRSDLDSSTDQIEAPKKLTSREKNDIKKSITFYKEKTKRNDSVTETLQYILDNY